MGRVASRLADDATRRRRRLGGGGRRGRRLVGGVRSGRRRCGGGAGRDERVPHVGSRFHSREPPGDEPSGALLEPARGEPPGARRGDGHARLFVGNGNNVDVADPRLPLGLVRGRERAPEPRGAAADDARARETGGFADADDGKSLAWLRKTMAFETPETPSSRGAQGGGGDETTPACSARRGARLFCAGGENARRRDSGAVRRATRHACRADSCAPKTPSSPRFRIPREEGRDRHAWRRRRRASDARGALSLLQTDSPSPGSASLSSSPRTRDSGGGDGGGASPRANALRAETVAAYGAGNATRSRTRRKSKIPPPPSPASVRSAANEVASAGVSISERAGENPRGPARNRHTRPAHTHTPHTHARHTGTHTHTHTHTRRHGTHTRPPRRGPFTAARRRPTLGRRSDRGDEARVDDGGGVLGGRGGRKGKGWRRGSRSR